MRRQHNHALPGVVRQVGSALTADHGGTLCAAVILAASDVGQRCALSSSAMATTSCDPAGEPSGSWNVTYATCGPMAMPVGVVLATFTGRCADHTVRPCASSPTTPPAVAATMTVA